LEPVDRPCMRTVHEWLNTIATAQAGQESFNDLHIDEISDQYEDPNRWFEGIVLHMQEALS